MLISANSFVDRSQRQLCGPQAVENVLLYYGIECNSLLLQDSLFELSGNGEMTSIEAIVAELSRHSIKCVPIRDPPDSLLLRFSPAIVLIQGRHESSPHFAVIQKSIDGMFRVIMSPDHAEYYDAKGINAMTDGIVIFTSREDSLGRDVAFACFLKFGYDCFGYGCLSFVFLIAIRKFSYVKFKAKYLPGVAHATSSSRF
jgi:hypothetical protein